MMKVQNTRSKRKKNQQKWPVDYRLEFKLPNDEMSSYKYCSTLEDEQAMDIFNEMFAHLHVTDHIIITFEKYDRYGEKWNNIDIMVDKH